MTRSLRYRLLIGAVVCSSAVLTLLGVGIYAAMRHALMKDLDDSLAKDARLVESMIEANKQGIIFEFDPQQMPDFVSPSNGHFFEIWSSDGVVVARSPSLAGADIGGESSGRFLSVQFTPKPDDEDDNHPSASVPPVRIVIRAIPADVYRTLDLLGWLVALLSAAAVAILGVLSVRVIARGIAPVKSLAGQIDGLGETDLSRRVDPANVPDELLPIIEKLNGLLSRLEGAFAREKSFTSDVAHELRTPLAGLRATLEVCRSRPRDVSEYQRALDECLEITDRMEAMSQSLLLLARFEARQLESERRETDMCKLVNDCWEIYRLRAGQRGLRVSIDAGVDGCIQTDSDKMAIVLQNLMDNAVSHCDAGGQIRISVNRNGAGVITEIANTGSRIAADETLHLFERFWRGDRARSDEGGHCGLGLSLSQRLVSLLGGEIGIQTVAGGEFVVRLTFP